MKLPDEDVIFYLGLLRSEANHLEEHSTEVSYFSQEVQFNVRSATD